MAYKLDGPSYPQGPHYARRKCGRGPAHLDDGETKKEFEKIMGRPTITLTLELLEDLRDLKEEFLSLEKMRSSLELWKNSQRNTLNREKSAVNASHQSG